jgi:type I restriction-modification system DNA methylase subunit
MPRKIQHVGYNHVFVLNVPSELRSGEKIPDDERIEALAYVKNKMQEWFGGGTHIHSIPGKGFWGLESGEIADEHVDLVYSNGNAAQLDMYREAFLDLAAELAHKLDQEAIACRIDREMFFISPEERLEHEKRKSLPLRPIDRYRSIMAALLKLDSVEKARDLFCNVLHYKDASHTLPITEWPDSILGFIASGFTPEIIAEQNEFKIIYIKLSSNHLMHSQQRPIIQRIMQDDPTMKALLVMSDIEEKEWDLINVSYSTSKNGEGSLAVRRMRVAENEQMRTVVERLSRIDIDFIGENATAADIQQAHDEAFNVQAVSKEFFHKYREVFENVEERIKGFRSDQDEDKRLFVQQLFNRLMFIAFIQKKGWLKFNSNVDYLNELWQDYKKERKKGSNFYDDRLKVLFFEGLNKQESSNRNLIGEVPFLNGGLFEEDANDQNEKIKVPDSCIRSILYDLFARFDFTTSEGTPIDQVVAVDPEMLGHVFEELVTFRQETGSYYTPKPIVSFMCREALKGYLKARVSSESDIAISAFVENRDSSAIREPEAVLNALRSITVCDPACGSGAYLLGMLHELLYLRDCLFAAHQIGSREAYGRKLEIIQTNLYGVDIDPFATNIAKLRLWLSLAVDFEGDEPLPLPNLEFKIETGDSLTAPNPRQVEQQAFRDGLVRKFQEKKEHHMRAHADEKDRLYQEISELRKQITQWTRPGEDIPGFDWAIEFAEVFADKGFDVVVTNPPYGLKIPNDMYSKLEYSVYNDSYALFLQRAIEALLKPTGQLSYIIPVSWQSGEKYVSLRSLLLSKGELVYIVNLPYDVFETAYVDTCVMGFSLSEDAKTGELCYRAALLDKRIKIDSPDVIGQQLETISLSRANLGQEKILRVSQDSVDFAEKIDQSCKCRIDDILDSKRGIEAYKYSITQSRRKGWQRYFKGNVYRYNLDHQGYDYVQLEENSLRYHHGARLGVRRIVSRSNRLMAAFMGEDFVVKKDIYCFVLKEGTSEEDLWFYLALFNSSLMSYIYLSTYAAAQKDDFRQVTLQGLRNLPVPKVSKSKRKQLADLARKISESKVLEKDEKKIDELIYAAFKLDKKEVEIVNEFLERKG